MAAESICDLRIGQVGVATLKLRQFDLDGIGREMAAKVRAAPQLLERAAVIVDLNEFSAPPGSGELNALLDTLRQAGMLPVGLTYGSPAIDALARAVGLPLFSRFRANFDTETPASSTAPAAAPAPPPRPVSAPAGVHVHDGHVRSGQQIYARGCDLTVIGQVSAGAELIADGCIHVYGGLRGRALAGAAGETQARVFCREFEAELVAVAGNYRVLEDADPKLRGKSVQVRLQGERLLFEPLS